jgi:hypothetical protein
MQADGQEPLASRDEASNGNNFLGNLCLAYDCLHNNRTWLTVAGHGPSPSRGRWRFDRHLRVQPHRTARLAQ